MIANGVRKAARELLQELDENRLEVCKIRGNQGTYIRCVITENAEWYRKLCAQWEKPRRRYRKPRTMIRRQHVRRALNEIATGRKETVYADRIFQFVVEGANEMIQRTRRIA